MDSVLKTISVVADIMTILGIGGVLTYGAILRDKNLIGRRLSNLSIGMLKFSLIAIIWIVCFRLAGLPYMLILLFLKEDLHTSLYWEQGKELYHIIAYLAAATLVGPFLIIITLSTLTFSLYYPKLFFEKLTRGWYSFDRSEYQRFADLEILEANYGANNFLMDVTPIVQAMVEDGRLRVRASNSLAGDPIKGRRKELTIKYCLNGEERKGSVKEGGILEIP